MHNRFMPGLVEREKAMMECPSIEERRQLQRLLRKLCANAPAWSGAAHV
jgi:hypothetical protein